MRKTGFIRRFLCLSGLAVFISIFACPAGVLAAEKTPIISDIYTADPSARVFDGKIYIYPSHDIEGNGVQNNDGDVYAMRDYHVLSMDSISSECIDHGTALDVDSVPWAEKQMWAPDAIRVGDTYYLVFPAKDYDGIFRLGVAVSDSPTGPFRAEENYIEGSFSIDPALFQDDDGSVYCYYGGIWGGQLDKWKSGEYDPQSGELEGTISPDDIAQGPMFARFSEDMKSFETVPVNLIIYDQNGVPLTSGDEERRFFEAPWVHKYNGKYYLTYSTGTTHYLVYAVSDFPGGPFIYQGRVLEPVLGWTTHPSIIEYEGDWYLFYHDCELSGGIDHLRNVKYARLTYRQDGSIVPIVP